MWYFRVRPLILIGLLAEVERQGFPSLVAHLRLAKRDGIVKRIGFTDMGFSGKEVSALFADFDEVEGATYYTRFYDVPLEYTRRDDSYEELDVS